MENGSLDPRLRRIEQADMKGKVVLLRVDHNVVKNGVIKDPYRVNATFGTLYAIAEKGGRPILLTHIGRPRDKETGKIRCRNRESVGPIVQYLMRKLPIKIHVQDFPIDPEKGILHLDHLIVQAVEALKKREIGMVYLPNARWFYGEESNGPERDIFTKELAGVADLYVNDAFGSYRAHASTCDVAGRLPSFAGPLLQKEIKNLHMVLDPERPFVAVVAGAKYDTKIGPLKALYHKADYLILGGVMYNTFLSAKYGVQMEGVSEEDRALARELVDMDRNGNKIVEMPYLVESDTMEEKSAGSFRPITIHDLKKGKALKHVVDIDPKSFEEKRVKEVIHSARTIFVNAVMGFMPYFPEGTRALYELVTSNGKAVKLFGGGDTLQELKKICPRIYIPGLDDPNTYYFTGGGSVLSAIEKGSPYGLSPVEALMD
ncbi:MAG: phosphoglycerate kinase [Deltaproteobacteria bacterium]|nr:phosphoglycerate kinase [Deltaproteobacteria bacterium]